MIPGKYAPVLAAADCAVCAYGVRIIERKGLMNMETGTVISLAAMGIAFLGLILNSRKETRTDAASNAITQTKLDNLITGVTEIRVEIRSMREAITDHSERLARLEAKAESNAQRLDALEKND